MKTNTFANKRNGYVKTENNNTVTIEAFETIETKYKYIRKLRGEDQ